MLWHENHGVTKLLDESEATSPTEKPDEGNMLSPKNQHTDPNVTSSFQPQASLEWTSTVAANDEDVPATSELETSSGSSSGDTSEWIKFTSFALVLFVTFLTLVDKKGKNYIESFDRFALLDLVFVFIRFISWENLCQLLWSDVKLLIWL